MSEVEKGQPRFTDRRTMNASSIVKAIGFKPDFSQIELKVTDKKTG
jgi:hypothetical protein